MALVGTTVHFQIHYTPTYSSWLNQVERWFGLITQQAIRRGSFRSVKHLIARIDHFVHQYNSNCRPFAWTATVDFDSSETCAALLSYFLGQHTSQRLRDRIFLGCVRKEKLCGAARVVHQEVCLASVQFFLRLKILQRNPEIQRQFRRSLPVILKVSRPVPALIVNRGDVRDIRRSPLIRDHVRCAETRVRVRIGGSWIRDEDAGEVILPARSARLQRLYANAAESQRPLSEHGE